MFLTWIETESLLFHLVAEAMWWGWMRRLCVGWVGGIENKAQTKCLDLGCGKNVRFEKLKKIKWCQTMETVTTKAPKKPFGPK